MLSGLLNIGQSALNASQAWISVTGNNLANAETEGYSRQYVDQKDAGGLTYKPGAQPLGVNAQQIMRFFDAFLERSYVRQSATSSRWDEQDTIMASLENIFNESNRAGVSSAITNFFNAWQDLTLRPDDTSVRQSLLSYADNLSDMIQNTAKSIRQIQKEMDVSISETVSRVNDIAKAIADLNKQITSSSIEGVSNPNALYDQRDQLVREMATLVDVETIDHGAGNFRVQLSTGQPLVDGHETYSLRVDPAKYEDHIQPGSAYTGHIKSDGVDSHEYTFEVVANKDGNFNSTAAEVGTTNNPRLRVSLDGGKTWLQDENGNDLTFEISKTGDGEGTDEITVKNLTISFSEAENFTKGDRFYVVPKTGLYWIEPTRGPENVTPQIGMDGQDNKNRVSGGKLAAYFNIRDDNCGRYLDELDAVTETLIWEVNRLHTQGAGLEKLNFAQGQQRVEHTDMALGKAQAGMPNYDKLQEGNVNFHFYNTKDGSYAGSALLFGDRNFDPEKDSLDDIVKAINGYKAEGDPDYIPPMQMIMPDGSTKASPLVASIQDGKLQITVDPDSGLEFAMGADSSGLMAALGVNTFFSGSSASDIAVNSQIHQNTQLIAAGEVNGDHEVNVGDNAIAKAIGKLADKEVTVSTVWKTVKNQSVSQYYANLVTTVGADRRTSKTNTEYHGALTADLYDRSASVSGVNMDEEMTNLMKYQHAYTAAAKLITTADEMLQTLLGLKQ